jgi:hypothetical protein
MKRERLAWFLALIVLSVAGSYFWLDMRRSRDQARLTVARSNMHCILLSMMTWAESHDGTWPSAPHDLLKGGYMEEGNRGCFTNPRQPQYGEKAYVYRQPAPECAGQTIVLYERYDKWPDRGIAACLLDGTVPVIKSEERLMQMLKAGSKPLSLWPEGVEGRPAE